MKDKRTVLYDSISTNHLGVMDCSTVDEMRYRQNIPYRYRESGRYNRAGHNLGNAVGYQ